MTQVVPTGSVRESADRICRFRAIAGDGYRAALEITRRCNIACLHCFVPANRHDPSLESLRELIRELARTGCRKVLITGGEPLLRDDLEEIVRAVAEAGMGADLNSNLVGLDVGRATALTEAGLGEASVSFYGHRDFHDTFVRRPGAFDSTLASCRHLRGRGVELDVHGPLWEANIADIEDIYELATELRAGSLTFFKVIGLAGTKGGRLFGLTRFGAAVENFQPPPLSEVARVVGALRERGGMPVRTIGFWGDCREECEQGASIVGLGYDLCLSPCLLSRRRRPSSLQVDGSNFAEALNEIRGQVREGQWLPVCADPHPL